MGHVDGLHELLLEAGLGDVAQQLLVRLLQVSVGLDLVSGFNQLLQVLLEFVVLEVQSHGDWREVLVLYLVFSCVVGDEVLALGGQRVLLVDLLALVVEAQVLLVELVPLGRH